MKKLNKDAKTFLIIAALIAIIIIFNDMGRQGLADVFGDYGLTYDTFSVNSYFRTTILSSSQSNFSYGGSCAVCYDSYTFEQCQSVGAPAVRKSYYDGQPYDSYTLENNKWIATSLRTYECKLSSNIGYSNHWYGGQGNLDVSGTEVPIITVADNKLSITSPMNNCHYNACYCTGPGCTGCQEHETAPLYTKDDFKGRDAVIRLSGGYRIYQGYITYGASVIFGNKELSQDNPEYNDFELKWSKITPGRFVIFSNNRLVADEIWNMNSPFNIGLRTTYTSDYTWQQCGNRYLGNTATIEFIKYKLPFNCDTEADEVKVFEVFDSGTLTIDSPTYDVVKFCREFKAEILNESSNSYTVDGTDEIYESLAQGETLTIPSGQKWALHYIARSTGRASSLDCDTNEEVDVAADTCIEAVGFAQRLIILQGQVSEQARIINELEISISEKAALIDSLELTRQQQIDLIRQLNLSVSEQAELINDLSINLQEKAAIISQLTASNERQAELIKQMKLEFSDQGELLDALNLKIVDDATIIKKLSNKTSEQGVILSNMNLNTNEQAELINRLTSVTNDQAQLINSLRTSQRLSLEELAQIIASLASNDKSKASELVNKLDIAQSEKDKLLQMILNLKPTTPTSIIEQLNPIEWFNRQSPITKISSIIIIILILGIVYETGRKRGIFKKKNKRRRW